MVQSAATGGSSRNRVGSREVDTPPPSPHPRIAVLGARSRHQGVGAHLARFCARAGAEVRAVLGTTPETAAAAADALATETGQSARPYTSLDALLERETLDALVIATPAATHAAFLDRALEAGCHVLSEKPLLWATPRPVARAEALAAAFHARGLHLAVHTQWPFTLGPYRVLHPDADPARATRFAMRLSPASRASMSIEALPHALSLLAAADPDPDATVANVAASGAGTEEAPLRVTFTYTGRRPIDCEVALVACATQPRPAAYAFDGRWAVREVAMPSYRMHFVVPSGGASPRRVPVPDPSRLLVGWFLQQIAAGAPAAVHPAVVPGMRLLAELVAGAEEGQAP